MDGYSFIDSRSTPPMVASYTLVHSDRGQDKPPNKGHTKCTLAIQNQWSLLFRGSTASTIANKACEGNSEKQP